MEITYRRLFSADKAEVLRLIQSRVDANSRICLTDNTVNQGWIDDVMIHDASYDVTHRVFGAFVNEVLNTIFVLRLKPEYYIVSIMLSTKQSERPTPKIVNGYNQITSELLDYSIKEMENEGYQTFYSIIPDHPKWKRAEKNPAKKQIRYNIDEVLKIPANTMPDPDPNLGFSVLDVISRPFNLDMVVRRMTRINSEKQQ